MSLYHATKYWRKLTKLMGVFQSTRFLQLFEVQYDYVVHICRLIAKIKVTDTKITVPGTPQTRPAPICGKWLCAYLILFNFGTPPPCKRTPKSAYIGNKVAKVGQNRPKFRVPCAKKCTSSEKVHQWWWQISAMVLWQISDFYGSFKQITQLEKRIKCGKMDHLLWPSSGFHLFR